MKLAEALIARSDLQNKITEIKNRINDNVKTQDGEEAAEDIGELFETYESLMPRLEALIVKINRTNLKTEFSGEVCLADALAKRDNLRSRLNSYKSFIEHASIRQERYSRNEVKFVRQVNIKELQEKVDALAKQFRELDVQIQAINWAVELTE
jgi:hypothetical protein